MNKFKGILFCTDLDGTLLNSDRIISNENKEAIEYFKSEGGKFTFITGRLPYFSHEMYKEVKPNAPVGCGNGCCVYDYETEKYLWRSEMPTKSLDIIEAVLCEIPQMGVQVNTFERVLFCNDNEAMEFFRKVTSMPRLLCSVKNINEPFSKIVFGDINENNIEKLKQVIKNIPAAKNFDFVRSEKFLYDILQKGIDKGSALLKIAEILGIQKQRTVAIGDFNNDIGMIKTAGVGIAVSNASDDAKKAADIVTVSNDENAVAKVISDIDKGIIEI